MPVTKDPFSAFPEEIRHSTKNPALRYRRARGMYVVRGEPAHNIKKLSILNISTDNGVQLRVYRGVPDAANLMSSLVMPVYKLEGGGDIAVPTGRMFARFHEGMKIEERVEDLKKAGYRLTQVLSYAPNAGWLEASDGTTLGALEHINKLEQLKDVENVEPQFIMQRALKSG